MKSRRIPSLFLGLGLCVLVLAACSSPITRTTSPDSAGLDRKDCCAQKDASQCDAAKEKCTKDSASSKKDGECCKKKAKAAQA